MRAELPRPHDHVRRRQHARDPRKHRRNDLARAIVRGRGERPAVPGDHADDRQWHRQVRRRDRQWYRDRQYRRGLGHHRLGNDHAAVNQGANDGGARWHRSLVPRRATKEGRLTTAPFVPPRRGVILKRVLNEGCGTLRGVLKEDVLEQIVDDYLQMEGYFTIHNMKFKPSPSHADFNGRLDSVASDVDVVGYHPRRRGHERVVAYAWSALSPITRRRALTLRLSVELDVRA